MNSDGYILFVTRFVRLFSYGFISVALFLYLVEVGLQQMDIGILFTLTLIGDLLVSFLLTTKADSFGRRKTLIIGALLKLGAGVTFAYTNNFYLLLLSATIGVITPTGGEIGPFLAVEQASLTEIIENKEEIPSIFAWYNLIGYIALALGSFTSGALVQWLGSKYHMTLLESHRYVVIGYAIFGLTKAILYCFLSEQVESKKAYVASSKDGWFSRFGLHRPESKSIVFKLSLLFIVDAFAGGFVMQTMIVYWFHVKYGMDGSLLGALMMGANVLAGLSALAATPLVRKIGAIETMVFTHLPSNILLLLVPLMPNMWSASLMLLLRFSISQMDVPARQTYVALVVASEERSAAGGITNIVRSIGVALSPLLVGYLIKDPNNYWMFSAPFIVAGGLKIFYDIALFISFKTSQPAGLVGAPSETTALVPKEQPPAPTSVQVK